MGEKKLSIAIVGAGIGGLAVAATLRQIGIDVRVYEQAPAFARVGAGIQMMPNSMKVLRRIGVEEKVRGTSFMPYSHLNRDGYSGEVIRELPMPESLFGAPYLCMHRAELHKALAAVVPEDIVHLNKKLVGLEQGAGRVTLAFADGTRAQADAVVGADGVHSVVRDIIIGPDAPLHKGRIAYRAIFSSALLNGLEIGSSRTKWWGSGPPHRDLLHERHAHRTLFRDQRAGAGGMGDARIVVGQRRREGVAQGIRGFSRRRSRRARTPARTATSGRFWSASRCRAGATAASCCWATPAIR